MSDNEAQVKITADASGVQPGVQAAINQMNRLPASAQAVSSAMSGAANSFRATGSAFEEVAGAAAKSASSVHGSAGTIRESMVLLREAANGNWTRFAGSLGLLAQYTGALPALLNPVVIGLVAVAAALGGVAFAANQGTENQVKLQNALSATNNWSGLTESQLHDLAATLGTETKEGASKARDALMDLVQQGRLSGSNFQLAARAALDLARAMGGDVTTYTKQLGALQEDTVGTTYKLQQQFHMLTAEQFNHVIALVKVADATGDYQKRQEAVRQVLTALDGPIQKQSENLGFLAQAWRGVSQAIGGAIEAMMNWGRTPDTATKLKTAQQELTVLQEQAASHSGRTAANAKAQLASQQAIVAALQKQLAEEQGLAASKAKQAQGDDGKIRKAYEDYNGGKKAAPKSRVTEWQAELDDQLASEKRFFADSEAEELKYWQAKLALPNLTKEERRAIIKEIYGIEKTEARQAYADAVDAIKAGEEAKLDTLRSSLSAQKATFNEARDALRQQANEGIITKQQEYTRLVQIARDEAQAEIQNFQAVTAVRQAALAAQLSAANAVGADTSKIWAQIVVEAKAATAQLAAITAQGQASVGKSQADQAKAMFEPMNQAIKSFSDGVSTQFAKLITMQQTMAQTMRGIWQQILGSIEQSFATSMSRILQDQLRNMLLTREADKTTGGAQVRSAASVAAGKAYAAVVGIPVVGPVLAPAAAATAYAGVLAFLPSAAKGYDIPAGTNPLTQLHEREMVLPADLADKVRNSTGSGEVHLHVHATDAQSVRRLFENHGDTLARVMRDLHRNGRLAPGSMA